jgi:hypothetical protein
MSFCSFFARNLFIFRPNGTTFVVPAHDVLIPPPAIGDVVTFSYESHARRDLPVNPKIFRIRTDVTWEEVVYNSSLERQYLNGNPFLSCPLPPLNNRKMREHGRATRSSDFPVNPKIYREDDVPWFIARLTKGNV